MGCSSTSSIQEETYLQQTKNLYLSINENQPDLTQAQNLISLITKLRNRIIYLYHKLIYSTAACLYFKPSISHCLKNIFYKISCDLKGHFEKCNYSYNENPPYLQIDMEILTEESREKINQLFNFIIELRSYKTLIKQLDKDSPQLLYLEFENNNNISNKNIEKIHSSIELFDQLKKLRNKLLNEYKEQIILFFSKNFMYSNKINEVGSEAYKKGLNDIYEIAMLNYKSDKNIKENEKMYSKIEDAKENWEDIMKKDFDIDIESSQTE